MELIDVLRMAIAIIGVLVMAFCATVWSELKKLRGKVHSHSNKLAELSLAMQLALRKVGINPKSYEDEDE